MTAVTRTQDEIVARIESVKDDDFFGFRSEVLLSALDFDHAKAFLKPGVSTDEWPAVGDMEAEARGYLDFAIGKISGHRGISASRSVEKLGEFAWLLGRDDVVAAMGDEDYAQYGAPKVKAFAVGMGWPWPAEDGELGRMAAGLPCEPGCESGCGS